MAGPDREFINKFVLAWRHCVEVGDIEMGDEGPPGPPGELSTAEVPEGEVEEGDFILVAKADGSIVKVPWGKDETEDPPAE